MYFLNMFHICSLVCFLIYGVNRRQVLRFLEDFALTWSLWDMMDMSMFRLLIQFRTFRIQSCFGITHCGPCAQWVFPFLYFKFQECY